MTENSVSSSGLVPMLPFFFMFNSMCTNPFQIAPQAASVLRHASNNSCTPSSSSNFKKTLPPSRGKDGLEDLLGANRKCSLPVETRIAWKISLGANRKYSLPAEMRMDLEILISLGTNPANGKHSPGGDEDEFEDPPEY